MSVDDAINEVEILNFSKKSWNINNFKLIKF
jgi:hypothetical protein